MRQQHQHDLAWRPKHSSSLSYVVVPHPAPVMKIASFSDPQRVANNCKAVLFCTKTTTLCVRVIVERVIPSWFTTPSGADNRVPSSPAVFRALGKFDREPFFLQLCLPTSGVQRLVDIRSQIL